MCFKEALNQPGVQLSLANTVSSAASFDFVLIRVNSARGSAIKPLSPAEAAAEEMAVDNHRHHKNNKGLGRIASMPIINEDHLLAVGNGNGGGGGFSSGYGMNFGLNL